MRAAGQPSPRSTTPPRPMFRALRHITRWMLIGIALSPSCRRDASPQGLEVVASTTLVADAVRVVAKDAATVTVLLPAGVDPHSFEPSPRDVSILSRARLVFVNGLGLEAFLVPLLDNALPRERVVDLSAAIVPDWHLDDAGEASDHPGGAHDHLIDPHVWFVPPYVGIWARRIGEALAEIDPRHGDSFIARADSYATALEALDEWIRAQVAMIPPERRILIADHAVFGHFARQYGFQLAHFLSPGVSALAEPSARDVAAAAGLVRATRVPAIFVGMTASGELARRVAADAGVRVVRVYTGSLSGPDGPAPTYVSFMRYNVDAIVRALAGDA